MQWGRTPVAQTIVVLCEPFWNTASHQERWSAPRLGPRGADTLSDKLAYFARALGRANASADAAGLRAGGWLSIRFTERVNCPTSPALFTITTSAPVDCSVKPSGSTNPESRMM